MSNDDKPAPAGEERWLHTPEMRKKLLRAEAWMRDNPPQETNLEELESQLLADK